MRRLFLLLMGLVGLPLLVPAHAVLGQGTQFEAGYGVWLPSGDSTARVFHAGILQPFGSLFGFGLDFVHVADGRSTAERTLSGGEISLRLGNVVTGPYVVAGAGMGLRHRDGNPDAFWSVGGGLGLRLFSLVSLGAEVRYRVEDAGARGFWQLAPDDRKGLQLQARLSFGLPRGRAGGPAAATTPPGGAPARAADDGLPPPGDAYSAARAGGASEEAARLTASVVETALAAMGSPYQWGGTDGNGFDCSGLIQYAYGQHGIVLPRVSRDQMRMGRELDREAAALRPGDILGFSAGGGGGISHVGLYVGDGQFIHSSSTGVRLSSLTAEDGDSRWWQERWVGARRVVE